MNKNWQDYYYGKIEEGKSKMSVLNAVRNKLIHIAMALIKNKKTSYEDPLVFVIEIVWSSFSFYYWFMDMALLRSSRIGSSH